ncbi:MAG: formyltransferase family protein [Pseudomonadota bacterium]
MAPQATRIVFLGMDSVYSTRVLHALYHRGHDVCLVIKPFGGLESRRRNILTRSTYFTGVAARAVNRLTHRLPAVDREETDPFHVAALFGTPCYVVGNASALKARELIAKAEPDFICISFFNQLLKKSVLEIPRRATLNAHPSLLPAYRGPSPLFWMFKNGEREGGITIHAVDAGEDSGDVLQQEPVAIESGETGPHYLDKLADTAAALMVRAVDSVLDGSARPLPQDPQRASRHARPDHDDLQLRFDVPAQQVFGLVRGLSAWAPLWVDVDGHAFRVLDATAVQPAARLGADHALSGDELLVQCQPGVVALRILLRQTSMGQ